MEWRTILFSAVMAVTPSSTFSVVHFVVDDLSRWKHDNGLLFLIDFHTAFWHHLTVENILRKTSIIIFRYIYLDRNTNENLQYCWLLIENNIDYQLFIKIRIYVTYFSYTGQHKIQYRVCLDRFWLISRHKQNLPTGVVPQWDLMSCVCQTHGSKSASLRWEQIDLKGKTKKISKIDKIIQHLCLM